jgi:hypothetical protein
VLPLEQSVNGEAVAAVAGQRVAQAHGDDGLAIAVDREQVSPAVAPVRDVRFVPEASFRYYPTQRGSRATKFVRDDMCSS